jgi:hypothetical protein
MLQGSRSETATGTVTAGTSTLDSVADNLGDGGIWAFTIKKSTDVLAGIITTSWDTTPDSTPLYNQITTPDSGDTDGLSFVIDKLVNTVRFRCTVTTGTWTYRIVRTIP